MNILLKITQTFFHLFFKLNSNKSPKIKSLIFTDIFKNSNQKINSIKNSLKSDSELFQEIFVLNKTNFKTKGFFVEFGACDGISFSNTYLLEKKFEWQGILAEPCKYFHINLKNNRNCNLSFDCVDKESGSKIKFFENENKSLSRSIDKNQKESYEVTSISLNDLLEEFNAPINFDYLSIDTEGNEYQILETFDFTKYKPKIITCEHNYRTEREKISNLLIKNGYKKRM